jgi:hypothetical protein
VNSRNVLATGALVALVSAMLAGCGSSSGGAVSLPKIAPARVFTLAGFAPSKQVEPGQPVTVSFTVQMPSGKPLTQYKTGPGPHTGVHLIIVRDDLAYIIHQHPPVGPNGLLQQVVTFPAPGPYHVLVDVYPNLPGVLPNFQLIQSIHVAGQYRPQPLPPFKADLVVDGYHFDMQGHPELHAIQAAFIHVNVTDSHAHNVSFVPWFGALAHAIFFRQGSLDYFHTHVCARGVGGCTSLFGGTAVTGSSTAPGKLKVGVLVPVAGTWRLFLQCKVDGQILTAPFTLTVKP